MAQEKIDLIYEFLFGSDITGEPGFVNKVNEFITEYQKEQEEKNKKLENLLEKLGIAFIVGLIAILIGVANHFGLGVPF